MKLKPKKKNRLKSNQIKIVSKGTGMDTRVYGPDGKILDGITEIEIKPIVPDEFVTAKITFIDVKLDIITERTDNESSPDASGL